MNSEHNQTILKRIIRICQDAVDKSDRGIEHRLAIPIYSPGSIGGTPCVYPISVSQGFDWDSGKIILHMNENLMVVSKEDKSVIDATIKNCDKRIHKYIQSKDEIRKEVVDWMIKNDLSEETVKKFKMDFSIFGKNNNDK